MARGRCATRGEAPTEKRLPQLHVATPSPIHPLRLAHEINEFLTEDTIYIGDGGDVVTFSGGVVQPQGARATGWTRARSARSASASPFAMAAKVARPDKEVVCLFGDGAFSLTGWDFETLVRFDLPFVGVVGNNSSMNQIRYGQIQKYGEERGDVGNKLGDVHVRPVRQDARRLRRGGPRAQGHPARRWSGPASRASRR